MSISMMFGVSLILAFFACFFAARIVGYTPLSITEPTGRRDGCIDGLRGYLALLVAAHHYFIFYAWIKYGDWGPPNIDYINNLGKVAVCVFFMITGYLFIGKLLHSNKERTSSGWAKLYTSRVFRIMPLYLFAVAITILYTFIRHHYEINVTLPALIKEIGKWLFYIGYTINGDPDARRVTAGVTWTLRYEWFFYLSLPIVNILLRKKLTTVMLVFLILLLFFKNKTYLQIQTKYFIYFLYGGIFSYLKLLMPNRLLIIFKSDLFSFFSLLFLFFALYTDTDISNFFISLSIMLFFFPIVCGNSLFGLLKAKESIRLGEVSYSIYILHGIMFYTILVFFTGPGVMPSNLVYLMTIPLALALITVVSFVSFKFIEKPFIKIGKSYYPSRVDEEIVPKQVGE
ncbi:acyltransferase family protein [Sodalis ligni]|uniref:Peptidoglycan/LPS O-acetylase OafA/YrhL n=1 Tax=Sodalis ligni TaxID=2697027 RepID=A0A4R1N574_9GAMM|nr:acyltransferase [Sodalis ligni]TCL02344.1 peptidoglycan/LPS O-acetylase OafA/YrhL [Sodalis ligni]